MTNKLTVPLIDFDIRRPDTVLELQGTRFDVCRVNWPEAFPYAPFCSGRIARTEDALVVDFRVTGLDLRAQNTEDNGRQWEDSCVEVFIQDPDGSRYYNFEINPLGKVLACTGASREGRVKRPKEEMEQILRFAQNDRFGQSDNACHPEEAKPTKDLEGVHSWRVGIVIPFRLIGLVPGRLPEKIRANFYKCGDKTAHPHFLSWNPVLTEKPDFHRPDFFGELYLV